LIYGIKSVNGGKLDADGVLGLGPSPPSEIIEGKTLAHSLVDANLIDNKQIGLFIGGREY